MIGRLAVLVAGVAAATGGIILVWRRVVHTPVGEPSRPTPWSGEPASVRAAAAETVAPGVPNVADERGDTLTELTGVGAVSAGRLQEIGITTFAQIAAWSDDDMEAAAARIKVSPERIRREDWVGQARAKVATQS